MANPDAWEAGGNFLLSTLSQMRPSYALDLLVQSIADQSRPPTGPTIANLHLIFSMSAIAKN
jgi:hypothetical protein